jgi:hypothetical protein
MGQASNIQHSFAGGEWSELMLGRQDLDKYATAMFTSLNGLPVAQGPWTRRPGTAFLHQTKFNNKVSKLIPFQYSTTQTYVLEFGNLYVRFFSSHGIVCNTSQSITSMTNANPGVITKAAHGYSNNDRLLLTAITGAPGLSNREVVVTNSTANTFELWDSDGNQINTTSLGALTAGTMAKIFEVVTTFSDTQVADIRTVQSADTLYILHPLFAPQTLVRASATSWALSTIAFTDGPYDVQNATTTTLTPGSFAVGTGVTLTASAVTGINGGAGFKTTDVGRLIRMQTGSTWGYVLVTAWTSTTVVTVTILTTLTDTTAKVNWRLGVWSDTTGWPSAGCFFEDRLCLGGATVYPQRLDLSVSSNYTNFAPSATNGTVADSNAIGITLNSNDVNAIRWIAPNERALLVGTAGGEWVVRASSQGTALTPTNISAKPGTLRGSAKIAAVNVAKQTIFVQKGSRKIREMAYVLQTDGFNTPDITALSEHITSPSITFLAYQEQPQPIVWGIRSDGALVGMTYDRDAGIVAWHRHELGGQSDSLGADIPVIESIAVVTDPSATRDELYLTVQRYINGGTKRYIEYMSKVWEPGDLQDAAFQVDCGWTQIDGSPTATITGISHLDGETVGVYADGYRLPDVTVANGSVTLNKAALIKTIGYFYNSDGETMPIEGGAQDGSAQGKIKRIHRIAFWLMDTLGFNFGMDADNLTELIVRQWGNDFGAGTPLFTGVAYDRFEGDYDKLGQVFWRMSGPFPGTVCAAMAQFQVQDES